MDKIASFKINHNSLKPGIYLSRKDGETETFDLRLFKPNNGEYMSTGGAHALEHLLATLIRDIAPDKTVYVGPMGCRTGFYAIFYNASHENVWYILREACLKAANWSSSIPGATKQECGNYEDMDLNAAKSYAGILLNILKAPFSEELLVYPK